MKTLPNTARLDVVPGAARFGGIRILRRGGQADARRVQLPHRW